MKPKNLTEILSLTLVASEGHKDKDIALTEIEIYYISTKSQILYLNSRYHAFHIFPLAIAMFIIKILFNISHKRTKINLLLKHSGIWPDFVFNNFSFPNALIF